MANLYNPRTAIVLECAFANSSGEPVDPDIVQVKYGNYGSPPAPTITKTFGEDDEVVKVEPGLYTFDLVIPANAEGYIVTYQWIGSGNCDVLEEDVFSVATITL